MWHVKRVLFAMLLIAAMVATLVWFTGCATAEKLPAEGMTRLSHVVGAITEAYQATCGPDTTQPIAPEWKPSEHCMKALDAVDQAMLWYSRVRAEFAR
jgi:hypothetical protein